MEPDKIYSGVFMTLVDIKYLLLDTILIKINQLTTIIIAYIKSTTMIVEVKRWGK